MFISIPKEFFVPVVFGEGFVLNEENNNLELDLNMYRESVGQKSNAVVDIAKNKSYLDNSKSAKEKQDIVEAKINMNEQQCGNDVNNNDNMNSNMNNSMNNNMNNNSNKNESIKEQLCKFPGCSQDDNMENENYIYMKIKSNIDMKNNCKYGLEMFENLDNELIENMDIKGCNKK